MQQAYRSVAIVGPRRLGSLLLLALNLYRKEQALDFKVTAIVRNPGLSEFCLQAGADAVMNVSASESAKFDVVFDTSGSVHGLMHALSVAKRMVHVKSTNGEEAVGLRDLTTMVINENAIYPAALDNETQLLQSIAKHTVTSVVLDESIPEELFFELVERFPQKNIVIADVSTFSRSCDIAIVSGLEQLNSLTSRGVLRPKAKGFLFAMRDRIPKGELENAVLQRGITITTSRCGSFKNALNIMRRHPEQIDKFCKLFISEVMDITDLNQAFEEAKNNRDKIKIVMKFDD